ncbi:MAG: hypothetical protein J6A59_13050 [Lachnospiraceae bacterium]|nr:hypothetical protein [Lachnospiraceae bacterium]
MKKLVLMCAIVVMALISFGCTNSELSKDINNETENTFQEDVADKKQIEADKKQVIDEDNLDAIADEFDGIQGVETEEDRLAILFIKAIHAGDYVEALSYVDIKDSVLYDREDLREFIQHNSELAYIQQNYDIIESVKTHEVDDKNKYVELKIEGDYYNIYINSNDNGQLKINLGHSNMETKLCKENFILEVPKDSTVFIRGIQLEKSNKQELENLDRYIISSIPAVDMEIHLITEFKEDRATINPGKLDSSYQLTVTLTDDEIISVRKRVFNILNEVMTKLNEGMTLDEFSKYFTSDVSVSEITEIYNETKGLINNGVMKNARFASIDEPLLSNEAGDFKIKTANEVYMNVQLDKRFMSNSSEIEQTRRTDYEITFKFTDGSILISEIGIIDPFSNIV